MSGFKGFTNDPQKDGNVRFEIDTDEVSKLIKKYKKLKKFQKSNIAEVSKLTSIKIEKIVLAHYSIASESIPYSSIRRSTFVLILESLDTSFTAADILAPRISMISL